MPECIHGLELALCDACSPKPKIVVEPAEIKRRAAAARATRPSPIKNVSENRLHVVISIDDLPDVLADGEIVDPIYFHGVEEVAWSERRRAPNAARNVVLVTTQGAVAGLDVMPLSTVQLIAVSNIISQEWVRDMLALTDFTPRVAVFPPWFVTTD